MTKPWALDFLSMDDSFGKMPDRCNMEVIPHLLSAYDSYPDAPGLVTWIYPFDAYCKLGLHEGKMEQLMMDDWWIESAIDYGFPVNTVISDRSFIAADKSKLCNTILTTPVPEEGSALEAALFTALDAGARVILYGTTEHASQQMRARIGVTLADPLDGEFTVETTLPMDHAEVNEFGTRLAHIALLSGGGMREIACDGAKLYAAALQNGERRAYSVGSSNGQIVWIRGSFLHIPTENSKPDYRDPSKEFVPSILMRAALSTFGYLIRFDAFDISTRLPVILFSRCREALWMSTYAHDTTVKIQLSTPDGAPMFRNTDCIIDNSIATYTADKAAHTDCRIFVKQEKRARLRCFTDNMHVYHMMDEKQALEGLDDATATVFPPHGGTVSLLQTAQFVGNAPMYEGSNLPYHIDEERGCYIVEHVTGCLHIGWQEKEHFGESKKLEFLMK